MFASLGTAQSPYRFFTTTFTIPEILLGQSNNTNGTVFNSIPVASSVKSANGNIIVLCIYGSSGGRNGIWRSTNGTASTPTFSQVSSATDNFSIITMNSTGQYVYIALNNSQRVYFSNNYGSSWTSNNTPCTNVSSIACNSDGSKVWISNFSGGQIYINNSFPLSSSTTWTSIISSGSTGIANLYYNNSLNNLYFTDTGGSGKFFVYSNATSTPTQVWSTKPLSAISNNCSGIAVSDDGKQIYLTYYNGSQNTNYLLFSSNSGTSFTAVTPVSSVNVGSGIQCSNSGKYVYVSISSTPPRLFCSTNYGVSWSQSSKTFTGLNTYMNILMSPSRNYLFMCSFNGGFFMSPHI